jgi:hypothetical protein
VTGPASALGVSSKGDFHAGTRLAEPAGDNTELARRKDAERNQHLNSLLRSELALTTGAGRHRWLARARWVARASPVIDGSPLRIFYDQLEKIAAW